MGDDTTPLLHPVQFPAVKSGNLTPQAWADHVHGSTLPPARAGYQGKHEKRMSEIPKFTWDVIKARRK